MADGAVVPLKKKSVKQDGPDPLLGSELGVERILPFYAWGAEGEIARDAKVSLDDLVDMRRRDGQARALMRLFTLPILSAFADGEWIAAEGSEGSEKEVEFANQMWNLPPHAGGMSSSKIQILKKALQGLVDGFAVFEEVRQVPEEGDLKGKITLRKLAYRDPRTIRFRVDDKGGFNGIRQVASVNGKTVDVVIPKEKVWFYTCLSGDTRIPLLDGTNPTIRELAERSSRGEEFEVYSNSKGKIVPGRVTRAWKTGTRKVLEVRLDNGAVVRCTPDHLFMLRDGDYREAGDLCPGDSLMPLYRRYKRQHDTVGGLYEQVKHPEGGKWVWTHRMAAGLGAGEKGHPGGQALTVHHKDHNGLNNSRENLEVLTWSEHLALHRAESSTEAKRLAAVAEMWTPERRAEQSSRFKRLHAEGKVALPEWSNERRAAQADRMRAVATAYHASRAANNHKVVSVREAGVEDVYDLTVDEHHNFAVEGGVFVHNCHPEENPFYGVSLFEAAYYHYEVKRKLYYIAHLAAQFAAVPGRLGKVPPGSDPRKVAQFRQALANFAYNTSAVFPNDYDVVPFNGTTGFNFLQLIDHHNHMMSKSVVAGFLDSETRTTLIEVGVIDPNTDFFVMALESIMDDLAELWSVHLMPKYIDWNFGTKKYPVFRFGQLSDAARSTIKEVFTAVVTSSVLNSTPEFVRELEKKLSKSLGLDIDYEEIEKQEKQAAEEEAAKADAEAQQFGIGGPPGQQPPGQPPKPPGQPVESVPPPSPGAGAEVPPPGAALSAPTIDDLVAAAQELLLERPEGVEVEEI